MRAGADVTVVAWGHALHRVLAIAERLAREQGISVEVIDPRWLDRASFDRATVLASVAPNRRPRDRGGRDCGAIRWAP